MALSTTVKHGERVRVRHLKTGEVFFVAVNPAGYGKVRLCFIELPGDVEIVREEVLNRATGPAGAGGADSHHAPAGAGGEGRRPAGP